MRQLDDYDLHRNLVVLGWISKYIHIIIDTIILAGALRARQRSRVGHDFQAQQGGEQCYGRGALFALNNI